MALRAVADEIDARPPVLARDDGSPIDALPIPQLEEVAPERIVAEGGEHGASRPLTGRRDRRIRDIAPEARKIEALASPFDLGELHQRLAEGQDIGRFHCGDVLQVAAVECPFVRATSSVVLTALSPPPCGEGQGGGAGAGMNRDDS